MLMQCSINQNEDTHGSLKPTQGCISFSSGTVFVHYDTEYRCHFFHMMDCDEKDRFGGEEGIQRKDETLILAKRTELVFA
jgi:hypothetical protein